MLVALSATPCAIPTRMHEISMAGALEMQKLTL